MAAVLALGATLASGNATYEERLLDISAGRSVSREVLKLCDEQLAIPMIGRIESLNVSAAAAVMLFEAVRQRIGE